METTVNFKERYNELTRQLLIQSGKEMENLIISPLSILILLCMAADSVAGLGKDEIVKVICDDLSYEEVKQIIKEMIEKLDGETLSIANALALDENFEKFIKEEYKEKLLADYKGEVFASAGLISEINNWVKEKTKGMIERLADDSLKGLCACLMNAVCFNAEWDEPYGEDDIKPMTFNNADGTTSEVDSLFSKEHLYIRNENYEGFIRQYKDGKYSFMALLPKQSSYERFDELLAEIDFSEIYHNSIDTSVKALLPEFRYDFSETMNDFLKDKGIRTIFSPQADFSLMSEKELYVSSIIHKAHIELDRKGTKAAAATGMMLFTSVAPNMSIIPMIILNRPFVYAIMHNETGLPVFAGITAKL